MPKWSKNAKEFVVSVIDNKKAQVRFSNIPKPILEELGNPNRLKFMKIRGKIIIKSGDK